MRIFTLKGPAVIAAIVHLGCDVYVDPDSYLDGYTVHPQGDPFDVIATFDLCPDGAFRLGEVMENVCMSWHELETKLRAVCGG